MIKRAQDAKRLNIMVHDLRDYTKDKHRKVDDRPFGGGSGMVMSAQPIFDAVAQIKRKVSCPLEKRRIILLCPQGRTFTQKLARHLSSYKHLVLICGHYEGVDERVRQYIVDEEISIGDFVLSGGEIPAMVIVDAVMRLIPGVLGDKNSLKFESFEGNLLEYAQYTRPADFKGKRVPDILLSGNHKQIEAWRLKDALKRTRQRRPDMLK